MKFISSKFKIGTIFLTIICLMVIYLSTQINEMSQSSKHSILKLNTLIDRVAERGLSEDEIKFSIQKEIDKAKLVKDKLSIINIVSIFLFFLLLFSILLLDEMNIYARLICFVFLLILGFLMNVVI